MSEIHFRLHFDKMAAGGHFGCPKFTLDRISGHFISIPTFLHFEWDDNVNYRTRPIYLNTDVSRDIRCSPDAVPVMLPSHLVVYESPDEVMARWHMECDDSGVSRNAQLRADVGLMMFEDWAFEPMSLPVGTNTKTQVDVRWEPTSVVVPSSDDTGVTQDAQLRTDVCLMMSEDLAMEPMSLPVVANMETQVDVGWESTLVVVPSRGRLVGWLDTISDCCVVDENMLDTEMSPIVSVWNAAEPAFLPTKSQVFSLAGRGRDSHSTSVCPTGCWDSDAAVVGTGRVDDVMGDTLDVVGESVGRSCARMDSGEAWPVLQDEHTVQITFIFIYFFLRLRFCVCV